MKKGLQWFTALAFTLCLLASAPVFAQGKVDINQATPKELMSLKGVGEARAKAIIKYRQMNGPFGSIDDLKNVPGVGDKIISDNRGNIAVGKAGKVTKGQKEMIGASEKIKQGKGAKGKATKEMKGAKDKAKKGMAGASDKSKKKVTGASSTAKKAMSGKASKAKKTMDQKKK